MGLTSAAWPARPGAARRSQEPGYQLAHQNPQELALSTVPLLRDSGRLMYTSTFTFAKREFDDAFHALDQVIAQVAKAIPGYLGEESWENPSTGLISNVYYWETMDSLRALMEHPAHLAAKQQQAQWLRGYQVVIAEVRGCYGDQGIAHPLAHVTLALQGRAESGH